MTRARLVMCLAAGLVVGISPLAAQEPGRLAGRVLSAEGNPVVDALASLALVGDPTWRHATTDRTGGFRFADLGPGRYRLRVQRIGYRPFQDDSVAVGADASVSLTIRLGVAPRQLAPLVASEMPVLTVNRLAPGFDRSVGPDQLALLPVPDDARSLIRILPGVRPDQVWGAPTAQANNYQIDGVWINHPGQGGDLLQPNPTWIERVEVAGLGTGAQFGNFQGGIVNVVTKSGTSRFDGALRLAGESRHLNGSNLVRNEIGTEPAARWDADGYVRGPLVKDRLFYALFGELVTRDLRVLNNVRQIAGAYAPISPAETDRKFLAKLSWQPSGRDAVTVAAAELDQDVDHDGMTGFQSPEATVALRARNHYLNLLWQRSWSARSFLEVRAGGVFGSDQRDPYGGSGEPGVRTLNESVAHSYQNAEFRESRRPRSVSLGAQWTVDLTRWGGEHHLTLGAETQLGSWVYQRVRNGGMTWRPGERLTDPAFVPSDPATWIYNQVLTTTWGGNVALDAGLENTAAYLQDDLAIGRRLTLHAGARWGRWVGQLAPAVGQPRFTAVRASAVEPRLGLTVALDHRGSILAKVHWGRYHQSLFAGLFDRAEGANVYANEEQWSYTGPPLSDPTVPFSEAQRDELAAQGLFQRVQTVRLNEAGRVEGYRQPYVEQLVGGLEATIGPAWKVEAVFVHRRNRDMVALVDRNLAADYTVFRNVRVLDRFFQPVSWGGKDLILPRLALSNADILALRATLGPNFQLPLSAAELGALTYDPDYVLTTVPEATRRFDQLQLVVDGRHPGWWVSASAAFTRLRGNLNSVTGNDDASLSGAGPFVRLNEQFAFYGDLSHQSQVELKLQVGARLPVGFRGGMFVRVVLGRRRHALSHPVRSPVRVRSPGPDRPLRAGSPDPGLLPGVDRRPADLLGPPGLVSVRLLCHGRPPPRPHRADRPGPAAACRRCFQHPRCLDHLRGPNVSHR